MCGHYSSSLISSAFLSVFFAILSSVNVSQFIITVLPSRISIAETADRNQPNTITNHHKNKLNTMAKPHAIINLPELTISSFPIYKVFDLIKDK